MVEMALTMEMMMLMYLSWPLVLISSLEDRMDTKMMEFMRKLVIARPISRGTMIWYPASIMISSSVMETLNCIV